VPAWRTRGHPAALAMVARAVAARTPPQSLLIVGPEGAGKTTLALDLAAGLLCGEDDPTERPCGRCSSCRKVAHGNHPDLHRLAPQGAGRAIRIGAATNPEPGTARWLIRELALAPMEGAVRVAVVEDADRMNEDAQNALLRTLEEPPPGSCLVICAGNEEAVLPTVRSRCARLRIGRVPDADVAAVLGERGLADAARAAAIARVADGRPGRAIALARAPEAMLDRDRIARELLDLAGAGPEARLAAARGLIAAADDVENALEQAMATTVDAGRSAANPRTAARRGPTRASAGSAVEAEPGVPSPAGAAPDDTPPSGGADSGPEAADSRAAPAARRRAVLSLGSTWRGLARDLAVARRGGRAELREVGLLEEITALAGRLGDGDVERFLDLLDRCLAAVELNANPELVADVLLLSWPGPGEGGTP
jgi:DNA polymerase III subunit delta'